MLSSPVLYAVGMAEKGSPCARRLGVATETTGVVRVWAPAASRWAFCQRGPQHVSESRTERIKTSTCDPKESRLIFCLMYTLTCWEWRCAHGWIHNGVPHGVNLRVKCGFTVGTFLMTCIKTLSLFSVIYRITLKAHCSTLSCHILFKLSFQEY